MIRNQLPMMANNERLKNMPLTRNENVPTQVKNKVHMNMARLSCGVALGAMLVLGGCGPKTETGEKAATKITKIGNITNDKIISSVKKRNISDAEGQKALAELGLNESREDGLNWASKKGDKGHYVFTDLTLGDADELVTIKYLELTGTHLEGDKPRIDQVKFKDIVTVEDEDGKKGKIASLILTNPSPDFVQMMAEVLGGERDSFDDFEGDISFDSVEMTGLKIHDGEEVISLSSLKGGKTKDGSGMFTMSDFSLNAQTGRGYKKESFTAHVGNVTINGANLEKYSKIMSSLDEDDFADLLKGPGMFSPDYKNFSISDISIEGMGLNIDLDKLSAVNTIKNGKIHSHQIMTPLTITPPAFVEGQKSDDGGQEIAKMFETLGYKKMVITSEQNSIMDEKRDTVVIFDSHMTLENGFKLNYDMDVTGYKAYMQAAMSLGEESGKGINKGADEALELLESLGINRLKINIEDRSIVDRGFKAAAAQTGTKPETLRTQAKMGLAFLPMMAKTELQQKLASELTGALGTWLGKGGTLSLEMDPKTTVKFKDLVDESNHDLDVGALGIKITHTK